MFSEYPPTRRRGFTVAVVIALLAVTLIGLLLTPAVPRETRELVGGIGLLLAGVVATVCLAWRAAVSRGGRRRSWALLSSAGALAVTGNLWVAYTGADPGDPATTVSDLTIALALVLSIASLLFFPGARRRGIDLLLLVLDGVIIGVGIVLIASVVVYAKVIGSSWAMEASWIAAVAIPVLDVLLVSVALLLLLRSGGPDRPALALVASGFLMYAVADLTYVVRVAQDSFAFGTLLDLGWIAGYALISLAACYSSPKVAAGPPGATGQSDTADTVLVFGVLMTAVLTQVLMGGDTGLLGVETALWVLISVTAGMRQALLSRDNLALRRGLELRVAAQTADLHRMARETELLLSSVGDGIYGVDRDGRITFVNPSGAESLGRTVSELLGSPAHELFHAPSESGEPFAYRGCYIAEAIAHGLLSAAEEDTYTRGDGTAFPVELTASPVVDDSGSVSGAVVVFRDITQRREVDRMKNEFLSIVSHELRTPLTSIRGSLGLLAGGTLGELSPRASSMANIALESSERLTRLINDILDLERISSGTRPMELLPRTARELVEASADGMAGVAESAGITIEIGSCAGEVLADRDLVVQTLTNLLGNAVKFSPRGSSVVVGSTSSDGLVAFRVTDNGRGIPPEMLERVFERFQQVDSSDSRQHGGTGLGLSISRGIVERHGGRIWAESEPGVGTTVQFVLPAISHPGPEPRPTDRPSPIDAPTVLVCDDPTTVTALTGVLGVHGYRTIGVSSAAEAITAATGARPAAVLLDPATPGLDAAAVLRALRSSDRCRHIPVVIVSERSPESDPEVAALSDGWLVKPVSDQRLIGTVALTLADQHHDQAVLLVEHDRHLAEILADRLTSHGVPVVRVATAAEALAAGRASRPLVLVLDPELPDGDGRDVIAGYRADPALRDVPVIVYSATEGGRPGCGDAAPEETVFLTRGKVPPAVLEDRVLDLVHAATGRDRPAATQGQT